MKNLIKSDNYSLVKNILAAMPNALNSKLKAINKQAEPFINELAGRLRLDNVETVLFAAIMHSQMTQKKCDQVVSEFNSSNHPFTMHDLKNWLDTHDLLYKSVEDKYMYFKYKKFKHLYFGQLYLFEMLLHYEEAKQALIEYNCAEFDSSDWLSNYHSLAFCKALQFNDFYKISDRVSKSITTTHRPYKYYQGEEFIFLIEFSELYHKLFDS